MARFSSKMIQIWTRELIKDSSPLQDRTKYDIKFAMMSNVHSDEKMLNGVISSDGLIFLLVLLKM